MNSLQYETSPYLLQHKNNPVNWYAWKPDVLARAQAEQKPILVSIGYSTCHWCHVMEHESFEDEEMADYMNKYFICIKVDREERPDLDQIYMEACQIINGNGGWPLNCFLLPDGRPFFAGTYYPPTSKYGRPSWKQVLSRMANVFYGKREQAVEQAERLADIIAGSGTSMLREPLAGLTKEQLFSPVTIQQVFAGMQSQFDTENGGFGTAPKFPSSMALEFLLNYTHITKDEKALKHLTLSLDKMCRGGIYDTLHGGFSRYATDVAWLVPHFEKMLYDNALLVSLLSNVLMYFHAVGKENHESYELYKDSITETLAWVKKEMTSPEGGFYSATDADTEGEEGKFFVWSKAEIENILGKDAAPFCEYFDVTEEGNWEHKNILWRKWSIQEFAQTKGLEAATLKKQFQEQKQKLAAVAQRRAKPGLDDKTLLDWNALMCSAFCKAFLATANVEYKDIAVKNIDFLLANFQQEDNEAFYHTYKAGQKQYEAFLNDYAYLIEALLDVYEITFELKYLEKANQICAFVLTHFLDSNDNLFYFTSNTQTDIVLRRKDLYDNAVPSGNSTMVKNLQRLSILFENTSYEQLATEMLVKTKEAAERFPTAFSKWATALTNQIQVYYEVAVLGENAKKIALELQKYYLPNKVIMASATESDDYPLLKYKSAEDTYIYVCQDYQCQAPVSTVEEFRSLM